MALIQTTFLIAALATQGTSQVYPLDDLGGGSVRLGEQYIPIRSAFPDALEFGKKLGEEEWEVLRVRIHVHPPMNTSSFTPEELAGLARLGGEVSTVPAAIQWHGTDLTAWEVEYAEGAEDPIGMFGILAYIHLPDRWIQILIAGPSNYEDEVRTESDAVISGFRTGGAFGGVEAPVGVLILFSVLGVVGVILGLIGAVLTLVGMFQGGDTGWGIATIICCLCSLAGILTLIYSIMHRDRLGTAMWLQIIGNGLVIIAYVIFFAAGGSLSQ